MGILFSSPSISRRESVDRRRSASHQDDDATAINPFRFQPGDGAYFTPHFLLGGEKFERSRPDSYSLGDNTDVDFVVSAARPAAIPFPTAKQLAEPLRALRAHINIRRDSLRLLQLPDPDSPKYNIEFIIDTLVPCSVQIKYLCREQRALTYVSRCPERNSPTIRFEPGSGQLFSLPEHIFDPNALLDVDDVETLAHRRPPTSNQQLPITADDSETGVGDDSITELPKLSTVQNDIFPLVIHCQSESGPPQSHATIAFVEANSSGVGFLLKPIKQKSFIGGCAFLLQEIYGMENKVAAEPDPDPDLVDEDDEFVDNHSDCVICMSEPRDTVILPCRHLCICSACAESLRYQANNCPICRAPFRYLLQVRALMKGDDLASSSCATNNNDEPDAAKRAQNSNTEAVPLGFQRVSLMDTLNGESTTTNPDPHPTSSETSSDDDERSSLGDYHAQELPLTRGGGGASTSRQQQRLSLRSSKSASSQVVIMSQHHHHSSIEVRSEMVGGGHHKGVPPTHPNSPDFDRVSNSHA